MAKVSYVPYSEAYEDLFEFCGVTVPAVGDFGGQTGWDAAAFASAAVAAQDYLLNGYDDDNAETFDKYIGMLENYTVKYWSTESYIVG